MNCFYHSELIAVGTCQDCKKGLCSTCAAKYTIVICPQCNENRLRNEKSIIRKEFNQYITAGVLTLLFFGFVIYNQPPSLPEGGFIDNLNAYISWGFILLMVAYSVASIVAGWKALGSLTSGRFIVSMPIIGWLIYAGVKLILAATIGPVVLPIRIYKNVKRLNEMGNISQLNAQPIQNQ